MAEDAFNPETVPPADAVPASDSQAEPTPPEWLLYDVSAAPVLVGTGTRDELMGLARGRVGCWCVTPEAL